MSFFRDRSPVTPKITRAHGSGIRGSRRSCAVRSGLPTSTILPVFPGRAGLRERGRPVKRRPLTSLRGVARVVRTLRRGVQRLLDVLEQLGPAGLELLHALVLEDLEDVGQVDAGRGD